MHECLSDFDVDWCRDLINSPDLINLDLPNRRPPPPFDRTITNTLFSETLRTESTIRAWLVMKTRERRPGAITPEYIVLLSLGTGLDGHKGIAHGGVSALIMDQTMSMCATMGFSPNSISAEAWQKFKRSIKIPSIIICKAVCTRMEGERIFLTSTIEDGTGTVYCEGGSVCVISKKPLKMKL